MSQLERLSVLAALRDRTKVLSGCERRSGEIEIENGAKLRGYTYTYDVILDSLSESVESPAAACGHCCQCRQREYFESRQPFQDQ
jgi:hypothetical protein